MDPLPLRIGALGSEATEIIFLLTRWSKERIMALCDMALYDIMGRPKTRNR